MLTGLLAWKLAVPYGPCGRYRKLLVCDVLYHATVYIGNWEKDTAGMALLMKRAQIGCLFVIVLLQMVGAFYRDRTFMPQTLWWQLNWEDTGGKVFIKIAI